MSASDDTACFGRLASQGGQAAPPRRSEFGDDQLGDLGFEVAVAGHAHLRALDALEDSRTAAAGQSIAAAGTGWEAAGNRLARIAPLAAGGAHSFHARLKSRHAASFEALERQQIMTWLTAARFRTQALAAAIRWQAGEQEPAIAQLSEIATQWRAGLPIRLPGLDWIEKALLAGCRDLGRTTEAEAAATRLAQFSGRMMPFEADQPEQWAAARDAGGIIRFGFATTRLPRHPLAGATETHRENVSRR